MKPSASSPSSATTLNVKAAKVAPDLDLDEIDDAVPDPTTGARSAHGGRRASQLDIAAQLNNASDAGQRRRQAISYISRRLLGGARRRARVRARR